MGACAAISYCATYRPRSESHSPWLDEAPRGGDGHIGDGASPIAVPEGVDEAELVRRVAVGIRAEHRKEGGLEGRKAPHYTLDECSRLSMVSCLLRGRTTTSASRSMEDSPRAACVEIKSSLAVKNTAAATSAP